MLRVCHSKKFKSAVKFLSQLLITQFLAGAYIHTYSSVYRQPEKDLHRPPLANEVRQTMYERANN